MIRAFNNLTYAVIDSNDLLKLDFNLISQTSPETLRYSIDLSQFLISWIIEPPFIADGTIIPDGLYTHEECLELMQTSIWTSEEN
jgi:hypothetical protein